MSDYGYDFYGPTGADMWAQSDVGFYGPDTSWMWDGSQGFTYFDPAPGMGDLWQAAGFTDADYYGLANNPYMFEASQELYFQQTGNLWTGDGYVDLGMGTYEYTNDLWSDYLRS